MTQVRPESTGEANAGECKTRGKYNKGTPGLIKPSNPLVLPGHAAGTLAATIAQQASAAGVLPGVFQATLHTALWTATVEAAATGAVSRPVAALAKGVLKSMFIKKLQTSVALVATTLLLTGSALLVHRATGEPPPILAQVSKAPKTTVAGLTDAEFKELKPALDLKNQPWTTIPWKYSLTEARQLAGKTKKPIFMVVNTGNVMGCA
jgi:hypothetical protein